jgi:hypothetical protein
MQVSPSFHRPGTGLPASARRVPVSGLLESTKLSPETAPEFEFRRPHSAQRFSDDDHAEYPARGQTEPDRNEIRASHRRVRPSFTLHPAATGFFRRGRLERPVFLPLDRGLPCDHPGRTPWRCPDSGQLDPQRTTSSNHDVEVFLDDDDSSIRVATDRQALASPDAPYARR